MPFVEAGGSASNIGFTKEYLSQLAEIDRLKQALSGINLDAPQSRVEVARAAEKNPLLSQLLPFDPGVVMRGAAEQARLNESSASQEIEDRINRLLDALVGVRSVDLGGGPRGGIFPPGQTSFTDVDLARVAPPAQPLSPRAAIENLRAEGLFNPADFLKNAEASVLGQSLEKLGLGKGAGGGSEFLKILLRDALQSGREKAKEAGVTKRHKEDLEARRDIQRAEGVVGKQFENATQQLGLKAQAGASREELDKIAAGLGFRITGIFRPTLDPFGIIAIPGQAPQFTLEPIQRPVIQKRSAQSTEQPGAGPEAPKEKLFSKSGRPIVRDPNSPSGFSFAD